MYRENDLTFNMTNGCYYTNLLSTDGHESLMARVDGNGSGFTTRSGDGGSLHFGWIHAPVDCSKQKQFAYLNNYLL